MSYQADLFLEDWTLQEEDWRGSELDQQREALTCVEELLVNDGTNEELLQMQEDLEDSIRELESLEEPQSRSEEALPDSLSVGQRGKFRHTDGRWHYGVVHSAAQGSIRMQFAQPMEAHMLFLTCVDPGLVRPLPLKAASSPPLAVGSKVIAKPNASDLWEAAEIFSHYGGLYGVSFQGGAEFLPPSAIVSTAYASDPDADSETSEEDAVASEGEDSGDGADSEEGEKRQQERQLSGSGATTSRPEPKGGVQTETITFAQWEDHTRGIGSKLMAGMGYVKGAGLGTGKRGIIDPVQVQLFRPQAGLGSEGYTLGNAEHTSTRRKKRGGKKAKRRKAAEAAFAEREERRDAEWEAEQATGTAGVFALVNQRLGDNSEAAKILRRADERQSDNLSKNQNGHFANPGSEQRQGPAQCRKSLMAGRDEVAAAKLKIARLKEMAVRNAKDAVIAKQVASKLAAAEAELAALEKDQKSSMAALQNKEKHKKWLKF